MNDIKMDTTSQALAKTEPNGVGFFDANAFAHLQRLAIMFSKSELVPKNFQGEHNIPNVVIALEMAQRLGASALAVMQQIYMVYGKPGWSSQFIIACLNTCGRFEPLRFDVDGTGEGRQCVAWTVSRGFQIPPNVRTLKQAREANLPLFEGPPCSITLAKAEGWYDKNGSKWKTMPELMMRYRAATWFGRLYAPELLMGMSAVDEIHDTINVTAEDVPRFQVAESNLIQAVEPTPVVGTPPNKTPVPEPTPTTTAGTPQADLEAFMGKNGVEFDDFRHWLVTAGWDKDGDSYATWADVPTKTIEAVHEAKALPKCVKIYGKAVAK